MTAVFETERLRARPWTLDDAEAAFAVYGDPEVMRYLGSAPNPSRTVDEQRERLARVIARETVPGLGIWALERSTDGAVIGAVLLNAFPDIEPVEVEVGWHLGRAHWGRGYATEAGAAALGYGFDTVGLDRIYAVVYPDNTRSLAVATRLGMTHRGRTTRYYAADLELFTIDRAAWHSRPAPS